MHYNFAAESFHTKKLCSRLSSTEIYFYTRNGHFAFLSSPFGGLEAAYDAHLRLIGKRVVDFLLVITELFSLGFMDDALRVNIDWKLPFLKGVSHFGPKFHVEGDILYQPFVHGHIGQ